MKVKTREEIIKHVLENKRPTPETQIRDFLRENYGVTDISNTKRHLKDLNKQNCLKKTIIPGKSNKWEIKTKDHLKNIHNNYPAIDLKKYQKSIDIIDLSIFEPETGGLIGEYIYNQFLFALKESESLFLALVDSDFKTLYQRWETMFSVGATLDIRYAYSLEKYPIQIIEHALEHYAQHDIAAGVESPKLINQIKEDKKIIFDKMQTTKKELQNEIGDNPHPWD